jgi:hypothetical protein
VHFLLLLLLQAARQQGLRDVRKLPQGMPIRQCTGEAYEYNIDNITSTCNINNINDINDDCKLLPQGMPIRQRTGRHEPKLHQPTHKSAFIDKHQTFSLPHCIHIVHLLTLLCCL